MQEVCLWNLECFFWAVHAGVKGILCIGKYVLSRLVAALINGDSCGFCICYTYFEECVEFFMVFQNFVYLFIYLLSLQFFMEPLKVNCATLFGKHYSNQATNFNQTWYGRLF